MNIKVSVIIPTKNSEETIEVCLKGIRNQSFKDIEIIVVIIIQQIKPKKLLKNTQRLVFNKGGKKCAGRNFGASKAKGDYLLLLDSDMELTKNVVQRNV